MSSSSKPLVTPPAILRKNRFKNKNTIVGFFFCSSLLFSIGVVIVVGIPTFSPGLNPEPRDEYRLNDLIFTPGYQGEMWLEGDQLHFNGWLIINDTINYYDRMLADNVEMSFSGGLASIHSSSLSDGVTDFSFARGEITGQVLEIYSDIGGVWISPFRALGLSLFLCVIVQIPWLVIPYFLVMKPLRDDRVKARFAIESTKFENMPEKKDLRLLVERTDKVREKLTNDYERLDERRRNLITVIGLLLTALITFLTFSSSSSLNPTFSLIFNGSLFFGIILLLFPANRLLSPIRYESQPKTVWRYNDNIIDFSDSPDTFEVDLHRLHSTISLFKNEDVYKDNLKEIVNLYYLIAKSEGDYNSAKDELRLPIFVIIGGFLFWMLLSLEIMTIFSLLYITAVSLFAIIAMMYIQTRWILEDLSLTRYVLYYNPEKVDTSLAINKAFDEVEELLSSRGVLTHITREYTKTQLEEISEEVKRIILLTRRDPEQIDLFGPNKGEYVWCGQEVPILIVAQSGKEHSHEVYPKSIDGKITTVYEIIDQM